VTVELAVGEEPAERPLLHRRRAGIERVERGDERVQQRRRHDRVGQPHPAVEQRLERAEVDHAAVDVEALETGRRRAAQDQVVGAAVLDDDRARGRGPGEDADPPRERHRCPGRDVDRRRDHCNRCLVGQVVGFEAVRVDARGHQPRARQPDRPGHHRVAGILDDRPPVRPQPEARRYADPDDRT
jgi:hypothetical protein